MCFHFFFRMYIACFQDLNHVLMKRSDPKHGIFAMLAFAGICFLLALNINGRTGQILFSRPIVDEEEWVVGKLGGIQTGRSHCVFRQ
jgi:hypothetical protein